MPDTTPAARPLPRIISFVVPCYNAAGWMERCVAPLLQGLADAQDAEIILVNDGSTDDTAALCDRYAAAAPGLVQAVHQPNAGHGGAVNTGLARAAGLYFKVVDSDDWLDAAALRRALALLREEARAAESAARPPLDLLVTNYVYEHTGDSTSKVMRYANVFPQNRVFTWNDIRRFYPSQYLLMHSVIYRTALLRDCGLTLPLHTFYVDNLFIYTPLPAVATLRYLDCDLYHYTIGRHNQSVNERVMIRQIDQHIQVTRLMIRAVNLRAVRREHPRLAAYMTGYLSMMMAIASVFLYIEGSPGSLAKNRALWAFLRSEDRRLYRLLKTRIPSSCVWLPGRLGRRLSVTIYRAARRVWKFN